MIDGSFISTLKLHLEGPLSLAVAGEERLLVPAGWQELKRTKPCPEALKVGTLTGLNGYLKDQEDGFTLSEIIVHVLDPNTVEVVGPLEPEQALFRRKRYALATTELVGKCPIPFGSFIDAESFIIGLQAGFAPTPDKITVLELIASIRESTVRDTVDDGLAQEVTVAGGVRLVGTAKVPNPVVLAPFRTFREVEQPTSQFVLRLRPSDDGGRPRVALIEADGGTWKLDAIRRIVAYLESSLLGARVIG
jgi:hypothetical protein